MKLRRSMMFVPGDNAGMLSNSFIFKPDSIMFDLEDAVAVEEKDAARILVHHALQHPGYKDIERVVRINGLDTPFWKKDLRLVINAGVDIIRLPKTEKADDIHEIEEYLAAMEKEVGRTVGETKLMAAIESASGVVNAVGIATASPRMVAIALAGFDYLVDLHTKRSGGSEPELFYARAAVLHAARSARIAAYDVAYGNVDDDEGFLREVTIAKQLGFDGKSLIHPNQISLLHNAYAPTKEELDYAKRVLAAAAAAKEKGQGVVSLDSKMIDPPVIHEAQAVILRAESV